jgi:hypothetical protein
MATELAIGGALAHLYELINKIDAPRQQRFAGSPMSKKQDRRCARTRLTNAGEAIGPQQLLLLTGT